MLTPSAGMGKRTLFNTLLVRMKICTSEDNLAICDKPILCF